MSFRSVLLICGMAGAILAADSGNDLFQKGLAKERAEGDVRGAIQLYQRVASMPGVERKLAAEALFRIAECQQGLGNAEARKTYERIVHDFADQRDVAGRAGNRLAALKPGATPVSTELSTRRVWVPPSAGLLAGSISPDGRFLSYADLTGGELTVRDLVTGETRQVTHNRTSENPREYAHISVISPDQKKIAFAWGSLRVIDWDGSNQKTLYGNSEVYLVPNAWSSDGREILATISTGRARTRQLAWIPATGGPPRVLKTFGWQAQALGPVAAVSPDGRFIAYDAATSEGKNRAIYVLARDGSSETAVTDGVATDEVFGWMPDGKALLFATNRTGARELWTLPVHEGRKAGEPSLVKADLGRVDPLGISKDGSLLYSRHVTEGQVYTASIDWNKGKVSIPVPIARGVVPEGGADWSPNGKEAAYVAHRGTERESNDRFVVVHSFETGQDRVVGPKEQFRINDGYSWSPDGKSYLVTGTDAKARYGAYGIDLKTGDVRVLVQREVTVQQPQWFPDGKQIIYVLTEGRGVFIRNLETGTDREVQLGMPAGTRVTVAVSPDGRQLAFSPFAAPMDQGLEVDIRYRTLYVMPLPDGIPTRVHELVSGERGTVEGWSPDSKRLILGRAERNGPKVNFSHSWIPAAGGKLSPIDFPGRFLRFHPDGNQVTSAVTDSRIEFWTLQNLGAALRTPR